MTSYDYARKSGSLVNMIHSASVKGQPEPEIGMGATILYYTDRHAATITGWNGLILTVQRDHAKRVDKNGWSESQEYEYSRNEDGVINRFRRGKDGRWSEVRRNYLTGRWNKVNGGYGLRIGAREEYCDPCF